MVDHIEIINAEGNDPPFPFMIVNRFGMHVDLTNVQGQLFDAPTVFKVEWGLRSPDGRVFGKVTLKNGQSRTFSDFDLMTPYTNAYHLERERRGFIEDAGPHLKRPQ